MSLDRSSASPPLPYPILSSITLLPQDSMNFRHRAAAAVSSGNGVREDCWSDGATESLVDAWGERFINLSRGNLRQKDWKDVADSVNVRQDAMGKLSKTSGQCKNRIDTLKKRYKIEKLKPGRSTWPFFSRLDLLVGASPQKPSSGVKLKKRNPISSFVTVTPSMIMSSWGSSRMRTSLPDAAQSSREGSAVACGDFDGGEAKRKVPSFEAFVDRKRRKTWTGSRFFSSRGDRSGGGNHSDFTELARAVEKIGEIYEKVERSKLQQTLELERQRMEFEKDLEIQRMKVFMELQLELERMNWHEYEFDSGMIDVIYKIFLFYYS